MSDKPRLLMPSAGRKVLLLRELGRFFDVFPCGYAPQDSAAACLAARDNFIEQPRDLDKKGWQEWIVETCRRQRIEVVLPVRDGDMLPLDDARHRLKQVGATLVMSPRYSVKVANDKMETYRRLASVVPVPVTIPDAGWQPMVGRPMFFPVFAKDRYGAGSVVARKCVSPEDLADMCARHPDLVAQPYIAGQEYTVDAFYTWDNRLHQFVVRKRLRVLDGQMEYGEVVSPPKAIVDALVAMKCLRFAGPVNFQFIEGAEMWLTDMNLRFSGGIGLTIAAGADFPRYLYCLVAGGEIPVMQVDPIKAIAFTDYVYTNPEVEHARE